MPKFSPIQIAMGFGAAGALIDISSYVEYGEGISHSWGKQDQFRDVVPRSLTFVLNNADGRFTPGNTSSPLVSLLTEGTAVSWLLGTRLVAGAVTSIGMPTSEATANYITITCDDQLGNAGRRSLVGGLWVDTILKGATPYLEWPLDDAAVVTTPAISPSITTLAAGLLTLTTKNGSVFGAAAVPNLGGATTLSLLDSLTTPTGVVWPIFPFIYPTSSMGFYNFQLTPLLTSKITATVSLQGFPRSLQFGYTLGSFFVRDGDTGTPATWATTDVSPHFVTMGLTTVFTTVWTITATLFVDGVSRGSIVYGTTFATLPYRAPVGMTLSALV